MLFFTVTGMTHVTDGNSGGYESLMLSVTNVNEIVFGVSACSDGQIALSKIPGVIEFSTYELVIGAQSNSKTVLRKSVGGAVVAEVSSPQILDCNLERLFWITWRSNGDISFGRGAVPEQGRLLYFRDQSSQQINAVSVSTPAGLTGVWKFIRFAGMNN